MADFVAVTLLRHGVTKANLERMYLGWTDLPLTENVKQTLRNKHLFESVFDFCVTSDLSRARETAAILYPELETIETPAFREMNFGDWEMKTYEELKDMERYRSWINAPEKVRPPNGESFDEMAVRIQEGFWKLKEEANQRGSRNILLVVHGGVIRYLLTQLTKEKRQFFEWEVPHDRGIRLLWSLEDWERDGKCISLQEVPITEKEHG